MTRLRQKYKNLKKRLERERERPIKVARVGMPGVLTLEHDQMFPHYEFVNANGAHQSIIIENIIENAARELCAKIINDGLIEIETTKDPYGMIVVKCRLRVIPPFGGE